MSIERLRRAVGSLKNSLERRPTAIPCMERQLRHGCSFLFIPDRDGVDMKVTLPSDY